MKLKEALKGKIPAKSAKLVPSSFDVVGDIAIIEIPLGLEKYEKMIGKTLLKLHKNIKVVCKKYGIHSGKYRIQKYRILSGERRKTTVHKENGARIKLHLEETYFSVRSGTERMRIASMVKKGERVLVMFGGVAPFALVMAKNSKVGEVISVELNPKSHSFAKENVCLNKVENVRVLGGDARKVVPELGKFDRVLMPLPKDAEDYLGVALKAVRKGGVIHIYQFGTLKEIPEMKGRVREICRKGRKSCRFQRTVKCGQFSPRVYRLCLDFNVC